MKKYLLIIIGLVLLGAAIADTLTYGPTYYLKNKRTALSGGANDPLYLFMNETDTIFGGTDSQTALFLTPTATASAPDVSAGKMFYDSTGSVMKYYNGTRWISLSGLTEGSAGTLDDSYNEGYAIDVDGTAVTLTVSDNDNNAALIVNANDATNNKNGIEVVVASSNTGAGLYVNGTTGTIDLLGDNFSMANTGVLTQVGAVIGASDLVLESGGIINNTTNNEIEFIENNEEFAFAFNGNTLTYATDTGIDAIAFGVVDNLGGIADITYDGAGTSKLSKTSTQGAEDLTIEQAGDVDSSIFILSSGTGADAIVIEATAGGIDITTGGAGLDIDLDAAAASVYIDGGQADASAVWLKATNAAGGINIDAGSGNIDIDVTGGDFAVDNDGAGKNITFDASAGSVYIDGGEATANAIVIDSSNAAGGIDIDAGTNSIDIDCTGGVVSIDNDGAGKDITLTSDAGRVIVKAEEAADNAVTLVSAAGGIDMDSALSTVITSSEAEVDAIQITASDAGGGIEILSGTGNVTVTSTDDIVLTTATAAGDMIQLLSSAGTSITENSGAIQMTATAGGIQIQSDASIDGDTVVLRADGGATADILIHNDAGTGADCINLLADEGGITLTANGVNAGDILIDSEDDLQLTTTGKLTITNTEAMTVSGTAALSASTISDQVITDAATFTITAAMSGKILTFVDLAQNTDFDLPAEADGLNYEIWYVGDAIETHDHTIDSGSDTNFFIGNVVHLDTSDDSILGVLSDNATNSKLLLTNVDGGTWVKLTCDGVRWYIMGNVVSANVCAFGNQ